MRDLVAVDHLRRWAVRLVAGTLIVGLLLVGGTAFRVWQVARVDDRDPVDFVVVLGAAQYDGRPSAIYGSRLDQAARLWRAGVAPVIVTTGGGRQGDAYTEAQAGRNYLMSYGIPDEAVVAVPDGSDTLQSIEAVANVAEERGWDTAVLVSDPWHSFRARAMARDNGLEVSTSPTRSGPQVQGRSTQAREIARETAAVLFYRLSQGSAGVFGIDP